MKCYSLLIGARHRRGTPQFSRAAEATWEKITAAHFPRGFTVLNADDSWFDPQHREFRREESRQVLVCTGHPAQLRSWCIELGQALGQDELLVTELGPARRFVRRRPNRGTDRRSRRTK